MNSKLIKAGLAGTAALAVVVGGSTFAAWSDFDTSDTTEAGAGYLRIELSERAGTSGIDPLNLAPGQNKYQYFYLASADSGNTPTGRLTAEIENLQDLEDGPGCTTNSEREAEGGDCGTEGELADQARVQILQSQPVDSPDACPNTGIYGSVPNAPTTTLADREDEVLQLGTLEPGQGVCLRVEMSLPVTADNASQGDQVSWNWRFDLTQVTAPV